MLKTKAGSAPAKNRLGVVPKPSEDLPSGPVEFKPRHHGQKGHVYITTKATIPYMAFWTNSTIEKIDTVEWEDLHPIWSIPIGDITELKKVGGYGWKAKLVAGWALGSEVVDGLEIFYRIGNSWKVTVMTLRDGLFNHLIAMGGQKWGSWFIVDWESQLLGPLEYIIITTNYLYRPKGSDVGDTAKPREILVPNSSSTSSH